MTAQGNITAGGGGEGVGHGSGVVGVWKPVICIQLFLSSCPAPPSPFSSYFSISSSSLSSTPPPAVLLPYVSQTPPSIEREVVFRRQAPAPAAVQMVRSLGMMRAINNGTTSRIKQ